MNLLLIHLIFLISGAAGLIYEVIWARQFANLLGSTMQSASLVAATFMAGLGLGSYWSGRWIDRGSRGTVKAALRAYGTMEVTIGAGGLVLALAIPQLETLSGAVTSYVQHSEALASWHVLSSTSYLFRFGLAAALLFPVTFLMGATLPVLIKAIGQADLENISKRIGLLYGINTAGAALGALSVDFFLIPAWGLLASQWVAVSLNLLAGLGAAALAKGLPVTRNEPSRETETPAARAQSTNPVGLFIGLFGAGFVAMGLQLIWFRFLSGILEGTRAVFSLLLFVILTGLFVGSWLGGALCKRRGPLWLRPLSVLILAQCLLPLLALALLASFDRSSMHVQFFKSLYEANPGVASVIACAFLLQPILVAVLAPAILTGLSFPAANAVIQDRAEFLGTRAGALYLYNTYGAIFGALVTGFLLIPNLGLKNSILAIGLVSIAAVSGFGGYGAIYERSQGIKRLSGASLAVLAAGILMWLLMPGQLLLDKVYPDSIIDGGRYLVKQEGLIQSVAVAEERASGSRTANRSLLTNGFLMSWTGPVAQRYMRGFVHLPLLQLQDPRDILVICFGVGNTASAAALYPSVTKIEIADLSEEVLGLAGHFKAWNHDILKDPRTQVFVNDGREHLRLRPVNQFDLITLEPPPLSHAGVASLYGSDFYRLARSRLKPGGFLTQWLPIGQAPARVTLALLRAFLDVFPNMVLLSASNSHLIMLGRNETANEIDPHAIAKRILSLPAVDEDLKRILMRSQLEIIGTFVNSGAAISRLVQGTDAVSDDWPVLEHWRRAFETTEAPPGLFAPENLRDWCPGCFADGRPIPELAGLEIYSKLVRRTIFGRSPAERPMNELIRLSSSEGEVIRASSYLRAQAEGSFK